MCLLKHVCRGQRPILGSQLFNSTLGSGDRSSGLGARQQTPFPADLSHQSVLDVFEDPSVCLLVSLRDRVSCSPSWLCTLYVAEEDVCPSCLTSRT